MKECVLSGWQSLLQSAILHPGLDLAARSLTDPALFRALDIRPLREESMLARVVGASDALRGTHHASASVIYCRLLTALQARRVTATTLSVGGEAHTMRAPVRRSTRCRLTRALVDAGKLGITVTMRDQSNDLFPFSPSTFCEEVGCSLSGDPTRGICQPTGETAQLVCFTDGSYVKGCGGGYAAVFCDVNAVRDEDFEFLPSTCAVVGGPSPPSGSNYTAEVRAILAALQAAPADANLCIITDSLSAMQAITHPCVSEGRRHRSGARALVSACRKLVLLRALHGGRTSFEFVRSHTGAPDWRSRGNEAADAHAGSNVGSAVPFMTCEERFVFWRQRSPSPEHVSGNLRAVLHFSPACYARMEVRSGTGRAGPRTWRTPDSLARCCKACRQWCSPSGSTPTIHPSDVYS